MGYDAAHVREYDMQTTSDSEIFAIAMTQERIIVSADTDFGTLLALRPEQKPSVILFRHSRDRRPEKQLDILLANVDSLQEDLERGSIVIIEPTRIRIRSVPINNSDIF